MGKGQEGQEAGGRGQGSLSVVLTPEFTISHLDDQMWRFLAILTHPHGTSGTYADVLVIVGTRHP